MRLLKALWMWTLAVLMILVLAPIIYFDAWLERRERRRVQLRKFNG